MLNGNRYFRAARDFMRSPQVFASGGAAAVRSRPNGYSRHYLIHTMAKVGSKTIVESLEHAEPTAFVKLSHILAKQSLSRAEELIDQMPVKLWAHVDENRPISRAIRHATQPIKWRVISPVRDPVARDVSFFFECLPLFRPDLLESPSVADLVDALTEMLCNEGEAPMDFVSHPTTWFDDEILPLFSIDVYAKPFDFEQGFAVYESENARLVVPRLEDFSTCLAPALSELMDHNSVQIRNSNRASDKVATRSYYRIYEEFRKKVKLPESYLNRVYSSKYANHFYRPEEIEKFRSRWQSCQSV